MLSVVKISLVLCNGGSTTDAGARGIQCSRRLLEDEVSTSQKGLILLKRINSGSFEQE